MEQEALSREEEVLHRVELSRHKNREGDAIGHKQFNGLMVVNSNDQRSFVVATHSNPRKSEFFLTIEMPWNMFHVSLHKSGEGHVKVFDEELPFTTERLSDTEMTIAFVRFAREAICFPRNWPFIHNGKLYDIPPGIDIITPYHFRDSFFDHSPFVEFRIDGVIGSDGQMYTRATSMSVSNPAPMCIHRVLSFEQKFGGEEHQAVLIGHQHNRRDLPPVGVTGFPPTVFIGVPRRTASTPCVDVSQSDGKTPACS